MPAQTNADVTTRWEANFGWTRRRLLRWGTGVSVLLGLGTPVVACGTGGASPRGPNAATPKLPPGLELSVMTWAPPDTMEHKLAVFREKHPDVKMVNIPTGGAQHYDKLQSMLASDTPPDVFYVQPEFFPGYADRRLLYALSPAIKRDHYDLTDFWPGPLTEYAWRGTQYGLPRGVANTALYFNASLFQQEGLPDPRVEWKSARWTWDDSLEAAKRLTRRGAEGGDRLGLLIGTDINHWLNWVWSAGGELLDKDLKTCVLDQSAAVEGLQFAADLIYKHRVAPNPAELKQENGGARFNAGRLGMMYGYRPASSGLRKNAQGFTWDVGALPRGRAGRISLLHGVGWHIAANNKHPDAAWVLLQHLVSREMQIYAVASSMVMPARKAATESKEFRTPPPANWKTFIDAMSFVRRRPITTRWAEMVQLLNKELAPVWQGQRSPKEAATIVKPQLDQILKDAVHG